MIEWCAWPVYLLFAPVVAAVSGAVRDSSSTAPDARTEIRIGVILVESDSHPYSLHRAGPAISLAVDVVNLALVNSSHYLTAIFRSYGPKCDASKAPGIAGELYLQEGVSAFIGPGCTDALDPVGRMAAYWNIPIITGLGDSGRFKDKSDFQTLTRLAYCQCRLRKVFSSLFAEFRWTSVTLIMNRDDNHGLVMGTTLDLGLRRGGYFPHVIKYYGSDPATNFTRILMEAGLKSRVIVLSVNGETVRSFMLTAWRMRLVQSGQYVFIDVELFPFKGNYFGDHSWRRSDDLDTAARLAYSALLRISLQQPVTQMFSNFSEATRRLSNLTYGFQYGDEKVNFFVGSFHDSVLLYGMGLLDALKANTSYTDGRAFSRLLWSRNFEGVSGHVFVDDNGDRDTSFAINHFNSLTRKFQPVAYYWGDRPGYTKVKDIDWIAGSSPPNEPHCGYSGDALWCRTPGYGDPV